MHVLADPFDDDFESLPLAVRRKFFSNLERFRLEQTRLARQGPPRLQSPYAKRPLRGHHERARTVAISSPFSSRPRSQQHKLQTRKASLRPHSNHPRNGLVLDHESWQCFHSLPPKIQQSHFSKEEQRLLQQSTPAADIVDAADRAVLKFEQARRRAAALNNSSSSNNSATSVRRRSGNRRRSATSSAVLPSSMSSSSTELPDSAIEMDESIMNSFRWLDEDDLDLSLDNYHRHVA